MANKPTFYADGYTPGRRDRKIKVLKKWLGFLQSFAGTNSHSDPLRMDTRQQTRRKILQSRQSL